MATDGRLDTQAFGRLMASLAAAWNAGDADRAAASFAKEAVYLEPASRKFYQGRAVLRDLFERTCQKAPMRISWQHVFFVVPSQTGAAEFSFEWSGRAFKGVAIVLLENGLVSRWREYQVETDSFDAFSG
jgi:hypothetical protein